jgi:hypothetical protein
MLRTQTCCFATILIYLTATLGTALGATTHGPKEKDPKTKDPKTYDVWVTIEGPWAYLEDPKSQRLLLIAPGLDDHHIPSVTSSNHACDSGCKKASPYPPTGSPLPIKASVLQKIRDDKKGHRYVLSLPIPDFYGSSMYERSRVSPIWLQDPRARLVWYTGVMTSMMELHYTVTQLDGFSFSGKTLPFQDNNRIAIGMSPIGEITACDSGGRDAFKALTQLFQVELYVDLRNDDGSYPSDTGGEHPECLYDDSQNPHRRSSGSFQAIFDDLSDYIDHPSKQLAERARVNLEQLQLIVAFLSTNEAMEFENQRGKLRMFVEDTELVQAKSDSLNKEGALGSVALMRSIIFNNRHNGSGACRNPMLQFQVVPD